MFTSANSLVALAYAAMCLIWGSTWVMIKLGLRGAPPMTAVAVRFMIAAAVIFFIMTLRRIALPRSRRFLLLGFFLGVVHIGTPYALVYWGEQYISSGLTAILYSTMPINVAIMARFVLRDPLTPRKLAGIFFGFAGVWIIYSDSVSLGQPGAMWGVAACLASALCASVAVVVTKKYAGPYNPFALLMIPFFLGCVLVWSVAIPLERSNPVHYDAMTWFTIVYLAVMGSVAAFAMFFWAIKRIDVTVLSYQTFIIPILAIMIGWIFLGETVTMRVGAGSGMILAGIALAALGKRRRLPRSNGIRER